jgi:hypothetical protein
MAHKTPRPTTPKPPFAWVSAADYARYWGEDGKPIPGAPVYTGDERRLLADRRASGHERRWDASRGRRFAQRRQRFKQAALPFD